MIEIMDHDFAKMHTTHHTGALLPIGHDKLQREKLEVSCKLVAQSIHSKV